MALLAEMLVDEWMNRRGFFTVRGIKDGVAEIDLLGVRPGEEALEAWHVEVQASFRPIGYISKLTPDILERAGQEVHLCMDSSSRCDQRGVRSCLGTRQYKHSKKRKSAEMGVARARLEICLRALHG